MDARPILETLARVLNEARLEAILIGNAAAALQGAPVTTVDFDFFIRKTPRNMEKLKAVAKALGAMMLGPLYPSSGLIRLMRDDDGLQLDFMPAIHGVKSFEALGAQSEPVDFDGHALLVANLGIILASKRAAGRPRDIAVLDTLEKALHETQTDQTRKATRSPKGRK